MRGSDRGLGGSQSGASCNLKNMEFKEAEIDPCPQTQLHAAQEPIQTSYTPLPQESSSQNKSDQIFYAIRSRPPMLAGIFPSQPNSLQPFVKEDYKKDHSNCEIGLTTPKVERSVLDNERADQSPSIQSSFVTPEVKLLRPDEHVESSDSSKPSVLPSDHPPLSASQATEGEATLIKLDDSHNDSCPPDAYPVIVKSTFAFPPSSDQIISDNQDKEKPSSSQEEFNEPLQTDCPTQDSNTANLAAYAGDSKTANPENMIPEFMKEIRRMESSFADKLEALHQKS